MAEIFVSHAHSTATEARAVAAALRSAGYGVWLDEDLPAHRGFTEVIEERLRAADAVVVIWSTEAAKSEWVQSEADAARAAHKLVQVTVDGAKLPMPFDRIHCADLRGWTGGVDSPGWRKVLASVRDLVDEAVPALGRQAHAAGPTEPLLAVLAFDNLSGDAEMAYFSDGVSEEILQTMARGAELKVIGRGSSFQFRGPDKAAAHVAAVLRATHVLDGSVRRSGSKVRISASLIECERETTLWSDRFDRELADIFALQDEIAAAVAAALKVAFAPAAPAQSVDPAAYNLYLQALEIRNKGLEADSRLAVINLLEEATALAPKFAGAWVFLATMRAARMRFDESEEPLATARAQIVHAAETALKLDPTLGGAHQALSLLEPPCAFAEREALHVKALAVSPNDPTVLTNASLFFTEVGRIHEALSLARQAYQLDPMYPWAANWYANMLDYAGRTRDARDTYARLVELWPDNVLIAWNAMGSAAAHGDWDRFDSLLAGARDHGLDSPTLRGVVHYGAALRETALDARIGQLRRLQDLLARTGALPLSTLCAVYKMGFADEVFEMIDRSSFAYMFDLDQRSPNGGGSNGVIFSEVYSSEMMQDVRFVRLCNKMGLCDYWLKTDRWPDCAGAVARRYDFTAEARRQSGG